MPYTMINGGLHLHCRLTPRSAANKITGLWEQGDRRTLNCAVRAIPEKGKANGALEVLLADWLRVPKSSVNVVKGSISRHKTLEITGVPDVLEHELNKRISEIETKS